jgi:hypothetical protein
MSCFPSVHLDHQNKRGLVFSDGACYIVIWTDMAWSRSSSYLSSHGICILFHKYGNGSVPISFCIVYMIYLSLNRQTSGESASLPVRNQPKLRRVICLFAILNRNYSAILATLQITQGSENGRVVTIVPFSIQSCRSCYAYTTSRAVNAHFTRFL